MLGTTFGEAMITFHRLSRFILEEVALQLNLLQFRSSRPDVLRALPSLESPTSTCKVAVAMDVYPFQACRQGTSLRGIHMATTSGHLTKGKCVTLGRTIGRTLAASSSLTGT